MKKEDFWRNTLSNMDEEPKVEWDCGIWARERVGKDGWDPGKGKKGVQSAVQDEL